MNMNDLKGEIKSEASVKALARSYVYAALALGFGLPDKESYVRVSAEAYGEGLANALATCAPDLVEFFEKGVAPDLAVTCPYQEFESAYLSAFETNMPDPSVSLYEGTYLPSGGRPLLLLELKGFFNTFGLEMGREANDFEDTLTAELEFMQFQAAKQAQAEEGLIDIAPYLKAQRDFLERHLAVWLPKLCAEIEKSVKVPFYKALARLMARFVQRDMEEIRGEIVRHRL